MSRPEPSRIRVPALLAALALLAAPGASSGQEIPKERYLRFVPLHQPQLKAQRPPSRQLHLWGDRSDPAYRDAAPVDGIDDGRHARLMRLAVRFSPLMVRNTIEAPMAFERFMRRGPSFPMYVDTWRLTEPGGVLAGTETVDFSPGRSPEDDRELRELIREFHPLHPAGDRRDRVVDPRDRRFRVLYFDFPGGSPATWKREYRSLVSGQLSREYRGWKKLYVHPFLRRLDAREGGEPRYELVLQYFAFYPSNDGGNDHEGDWQPVNVVPALRGRETTALSRGDVERILSGPEGVVDELVIGRVEYFFHFNVMTLDFLDPNVYRDREEWEREMESRPEERLGEQWIWKRTREMAYRGPAEERVNTHPVVFIGGNNKGLDQLLAMPGGASQDGHASYPFPGLYKNIGPAGAAEAIRGPLNPHWKLYASGAEAPPKLERFDDPEYLRILPDWERVLPLVEEDPRARRRWAWHVLPVRWGYPAVRSPFAGVVAHAETGNLAPPGPSYNNKWNRVGEETTDGRFAPHKFAGTFPLGWQDAFINSWGFLNLTVPTLTVLPPFDFAWRVVLAPFRAPFQAKHPTYYPAEQVPFRFVGVEGGASVTVIPDNFALLFTDPSLFDQIEPLIQATDPPAEVVNVDAEAGLGPVAAVEFHIGNRFVSRNVVRRIEGDLGFDIRRPGEPGVLPVRGELELWEYAGSLRYNLSSGTLVPFVRAGYGLSWFRIQDATLAGEPLEPARTPWFRRPSLSPPENLLPNTWNAGVGVEAVPIQNFGGPPGGLDVGLKASYSLFIHGLGLDSRAPLAEQQDFTLARSHLNFGLSLSY